MPENSQNTMSKGDDPNDFNADVVIEYLSTADDEEKQRVHEAESSGKDRETVLRAADTSGEDSGSGDGDSGDKSDDEETPDAADPDSDDYDPYLDPKVPSSDVADTIRVELKSGESPTRDAAHAGYEDDDDK